ncbi:GNAT family N-acetyltransferase [Pseudemcibacter aquimaris]|uniref:GNAT family N-acetyltransferase n=1 Tax=Pseudemcibacter aquimaris TaxID=2857064 RepID=UPI0020131FB5|nr:GNAT family N-acetyltransferase [Pseudemcibacter aquimaris]MCC3861808.1 GNAT family N-acetyltransferase [Pseudemcibacter aquimaris]WDU58563.1 GNAT family N-acetyltransferase [Pseudemcibacter aquimaris]
MLDPEFQIETDRLILRRFCNDDLDQLVSIMGNWDVTQWLSKNVPFPYTRKDGEEFIEIERADFMKADKINFSVIEKASMKCIGSFKLFSMSDEECEIGYCIGTDFWGKGYANEMTGAVISWLKERGEVKRLTAQTASENIGSRKLLERQGFIHLGTPPSTVARCGHGTSCSEYYVRDL